MSDHSYSGRSTGGGSTALRAAGADEHLKSREPGWFRTRLTLRLAVPIDPATRLAVWRLAVSAVLLAPPLVVLLVAPAVRLTPRTLIALGCAGLPGAAALVWSAGTLREMRRHTARVLLQSGAEHRGVWLIAAGRPTLFASAGAIFGAVCVALLHAPLGALLPKRAPLHGMFGAGPMKWVAVVLETAALSATAALFVSALPGQSRERRRRAAPLREGPARAESGRDDRAECSG